MERVVVFGIGATAREYYHELVGDSFYEVCAFTVDREYCDTDTLLERPVVPFDEVASSYPPDTHKMAIAVGYIRMNRLRAERYTQAREIGYHFISYVSLRAVTYPDLIIGENSHVGPNTLVYPSTKIGNNVHIGGCCVIGHDALIHDHCFFSVGVVLAGSVTVGSHCYFGPNSTVRNKAKIAPGCVIGAGAVILGDTEEKGVYMAQPAEQLPIPSDELPLA